MADSEKPAGDRMVPSRMPAWPDKPIWDIWLSLYQMPSLAAADELGLFDALASEPMGTERIAERFSLNVETLRALLPMLAAMDFLRVRNNRYELTPTSRTYLVTSSPYYWGHAFSIPRNNEASRQVMEALKGVQGPTTHADGWESGQISYELGLNIAGIMNSHSVPAALGVAANPRWQGVKHLLDVGAGSGCFAIAIAQANPGMRTTVMDLPSMCQIAQLYIDDSGVADAVDTAAVDMFRQEWPRGHDACFFSNVFHDWNLETNGELAAKAFESLPSGGSIHLHEMLIEDDGSGPLTTACFSMLMRLGTRGRQYSEAELRTLLEGVGFRDVEAVPSYGYYSLVSAIKP
jgi:acetylserotonin N-methyltransferase